MAAGPGVPAYTCKDFGFKLQGSDEVGMMPVRLPISALTVMPDCSLQNKRWDLLKRRARLGRPEARGSVAGDLSCPPPSVKHPAEENSVLREPRSLHTQ